MRTNSRNPEPPAVQGHRPSQANAHPVTYPSVEDRYAVGRGSNPPVRDAATAGATRPDDAASLGRGNH
jgi:hypothetical protein